MFRTKRTRFAAAAIAAVAAISLTACSGGGAPGLGHVDPDEEITLDYTFWGNDDRAARYDQAIALFEEEHPNITINSHLHGLPRLLGEAPDRGRRRRTARRDAVRLHLPPPVRRQRPARRPHRVLRRRRRREHHLARTSSRPASSTARPTRSPPATAPGRSSRTRTSSTANGLEPYPGGGSWEDYAAYVADVTEKTGGAVYGGTDYTGRIQNFELQLRAEGKELFTEDGELGFTEDDLAAFWEQGDEMRTTTGVPAARLQELLPKSGFGAGIATSEMSWSNFLGGYIGDTGASEIVMTAPPTADEGSKDLYQKVGLMQAISSATEHPEAAATFLDFLINSPEVGEIFGATARHPRLLRRSSRARTSRARTSRSSDYLELGRGPHRRGPGRSGRRLRRHRGELPRPRHEPRPRCGERRRGGPAVLRRDRRHARQLIDPDGQERHHP